MYRPEAGEPGRCRPLLALSDDWHNRGTPAAESIRGPHQLIVVLDESTPALAEQADDRHHWQAYAVEPGA
jgi:hypothetical protein